MYTYIFIVSTDYHSINRQQWSTKVYKQPRNIQIDIFLDFHFHAHWKPYLYVNLPYKPVQTDWIKFQYYITHYPFRTKFHYLILLYAPQICLSSPIFSFTST